MNFSLRNPVLVMIALVAGVYASAPASATTFVMAETEDLFAAADVVVLGRVVAIDDSGEVAALHTRIRVAVDEIVKGPQAPEMTVVEPGGRNADHQRWIHGAPRFFVGERVLLFLVRNRQGELETLFLAMGKFAVARSTNGVDLAVRDLGGARALSVRRGRLRAVSGVTAYALPHLLAALRGMAAGGAPPLVASVGTQESFTFAGPPLTRWFEADASVPIRYHISVDGDAALGPAASAEAADAALAAWTDAPCSELVLVDGGAADPAAFSECDGRTEISFNDPFGEIADPVHCAGVLALGGVCFRNDTPEDFNGATFSRITEGDVMVNNGFGDCPFWTAQNVAELLTHEVGHTLGLAHSSEDPNESDPSLREATMYYAAHFDGRGAVLASDDVAAICALYPAQSTLSMTFRRFAIVTDPARPGPSDRLVVDGVFGLNGAHFDPRSDTFIFDLRVAGVSVFRLAVSPGQWTASPSGTRLRYRGSFGTGTAIVTLSSAAAGSVRMSLQARGLDLSTAGNDSTVLSLSVGHAVMTETVGAERFTARNQAVPGE